MPVLHIPSSVSTHMKKTLLNTLIFFLTINAAVFGQTDFYDMLADFKIVLTKQKFQYDPTYRRIDYPNGDVPRDKGVCTDVIIKKLYRKFGIDLQKEVHEDMKANFNKYPKNWGMTKPDKHIDHRRVPNLMNFFIRNGIIKKYY